MKKVCLYFFSLFLAITNSSAQLSVSVAQVPGTCVSDAQLNATGAGGIAPYQYQLASGASGITYPTTYQSSGNFTGLRAGSYTVQVKDAFGATVVSTVVNVTTSYVNLTITGVTNTANTCPLSPNGRVTITRVDGKASFSYALLQGGAIVYGPQINNNIFTGITDGVYTAQVTDACGEIRTFSTTVALNDYKWLDVKTADNGFITSGARTNAAAVPFDSTKQSYVYDGPLLFSCDSVTFRLFNTLTGSTGGFASTNSTLRRIYIVDLSTNTIAWDKTFKPADYPANTSPSVHLKINTNYRFYFDDLCNDVYWADRNYSYNNSENYTISTNPIKTCSGYIMNISHPSDWNTLNQYNSPHDTITILGSSVSGDPAVGSQVIQNYENYALSQPLSIPGITPGATYTLQIKTLCSIYTRTVTISAPTATSVRDAVVRDQACKLNTAMVQFNVISLPVTPGFISYSITSGPSSFTDVHGNTYSITYPIQDHIVSTGAVSDVNLTFNIRNLPQGTYSINFTDQCGNAIGSKTFTITNADVAQLSASVVVNQQCSGASNITFNGIYQHIAGQLIFLKESSGVYSSLGGSGVFASTVGLPASITFPSLSDGNYKIAWLPLKGSAYLKGAINDCDTFFIHYDTLLYKLPAIDTASGYVCTPGSNDGKIILFGKNGSKPYQFQKIDASGNALSTYQTDSVFTGLSKGSYNFRIKDNCGNATVYSYQIDTLKGAGITPNTSCPAPGSALNLTADSIYGASYTWKFKPTSNGIETAVANTRALSINSLSISDYGYYTVSYTIVGCATSKSTTMRINNCLAVLPVTLKNFVAQLSANCKVELTWQTTYEKDVNSYEVQQSTSADAASWSTISTLKQTGNNANGINSYHYTVQESINGHIFYRLKIIDLDGNIKYSDVLSLRGNCGEELISVYPTPAINKVNVSLTGFKGSINCFLYSPIGQLVSRSTLTNGTNTLNIENLAAGIYYLGITSNNGKQQSVKLTIGMKK